LLAVALCAIGVIVFGRLVRPPPPHMAPPPAASPRSPAPPTPVVPQPTAARTAAAGAPTTSSVAETAKSPRSAPSAPIRWVVAPGSRLGFESSWSGQSIRGRFERWRADIVFAPEALDRSRVTVTVDVASVASGDAQRDAALPSDDWLDSAHHPQAVFTATRFRKIGEGRFVAHGSLELRGVTRPLDLPFRLDLAGDRAEARGAASLDRTAFGVGQGDFASTDQIPAKVVVDIDLVAHAAR
jgi:polyisoprenoid-binding protein YceI